MKAKKAVKIDPVFAWWGAGLARKRFNRSPRNTKPEDRIPGPVKKIAVTKAVRERYKDY